jgi:hypothetical protein
MAPLWIAIVGLVTAAALAIPFAVTAGPIVFAHRAVLLWRFGSGPEALAVEATSTTPR